MSGKKELQGKIRDQSLVVFKTDKSGKLCADSVDNYTEAVKKHIDDDIQVDWEQVKRRIG